MTNAVFDSAKAFCHSDGSRCFRLESKFDSDCMQLRCGRQIAEGDAVLGFPPDSPLSKARGKRWLIYCECCARRLPLRPLRGRWTREEETEFYYRMWDKLMDGKRLSAKQHAVFDRLLEREVEEHERKAASQPPVDYSINPFLEPRRPAVPSADRDVVATSTASTKKAKEAA